MPLNSAGNFGGPQYGWGDTPGGSERTQWNSGRFTNSPEAGLHRGEWQWRGHGPSAQRSYGWDYQGGVGRDEITQRSEARMGGSFQARMAQERSGGLPQGRYAVDYDRLGERAMGHGDQGVSYDWGWEGRTGGMDRGYGADYGGGYRASGGGYTLGGGHRSDAGGGWTGSGHTLGSGGTARGGYGRDFRGDYGAERGGFGGGGGMQRGRIRRAGLRPRHARLPGRRIRPRLPAAPERRGLLPARGSLVSAENESHPEDDTMDRNSNGRIDVDGHPENTDRELNMQPGRLDDIESPEAYATRTSQRDVTGQMPGRSGEGERLHDREDMSGREGMAGSGGGNPVERGDRQAQTGGGADRVNPARTSATGSVPARRTGCRARTAAVREGEDIGHGIEARPADGTYNADGRVERGEDIGNGIRARRADEQDPGNPLV